MELEFIADLRIEELVLEMNKERIKKMKLF